MWLLEVFLVPCLLCLHPAPGQSLQISNREGLRMSVEAADHDPAIHVVVPGGPEAERSFNILLPEHVTVRARGQSEARHLYLYRPGTEDDAPAWKQVGDSLEYTRELPGLRFSARATLVADGILFHYAFENRSAIDYDMASAITDPRFKTFFYDPRLERTYVHHAGGFELLASDTPERLSMPLSQWLPARYHAQFTAPIPEERVQRRDDGITYYYKSRPVDLPLIATLSADHRWIAASFTQSTGNVWSNPELTCQHVDPQVAVSMGRTAFYEVKLLIFQGTLEQAREKTVQQRPKLQQTPATPP